MEALKKQFRVTSGIFISKEMLSKAKINTDDVELEFDNNEVRIRASRRKNSKKTLNFDSPLWECVGFAQIEGVNGRNHDQFIYDEK